MSTSDDQAERTPLEPLIQESTPSMIATRVRDAVAAGDIPPGAQLYEAKLARQLQVSRGPLREGLQRLTQEGLLVSIRNRGLFVIELTPENVRDMYLAREVIERGAAKTVLGRDPVVAAEALQNVVDQMSEATESGDTHEVAESDILFHETLVEHTGSERLMRIHHTQAAEARICIHALGSTYEDDRKRVVEHQAIVDAIRARDADLVDDLLVRHMADAVAELVASSDQQQHASATP